MCGSVFIAVLKITLKTDRTFSCVSADLSSKSATLLYGLIAGDISIPSQDSFNFVGLSCDFYAISKQDKPQGARLRYKSLIGLS